MRILLTNSNIWRYIYQVRDISDSICTFIKIRKCPQKISKKIVKLQIRLDSEKSNSRGDTRSDDLGNMHVLGCKGSDKEYVLSKNNQDIQDSIVEHNSFSEIMTRPTVYCPFGSLLTTQGVQGSGILVGFLFSGRISRILVG